VLSQLCCGPRLYGFIEETSSYQCTKLANTVLPELVKAEKELRARIRSLLDFEHHYGKNVTVERAHDHYGVHTVYGSYDEERNSHESLSPQDVREKIQTLSEMIGLFLSTQRVQKDEVGLRSGLTRLVVDWDALEAHNKGAEGLRRLYAEEHEQRDGAHSLLIDKVGQIDSSM